MKNKIKSIFVTFLKFAITSFTSLLNKLILREENDFPYKSLAATNKAEKVNDYLEALKWGLDNRINIKNIAITGSYGSGKTSVINTFVEKNKFNRMYKFLNISLATFKDNLKEENDDKTDELRLIELSILQQLFYHELDKSVPDSRFTKIINQKRFNLFITSICSLISIVSFLYLLFPDFLEKFYLIKIENTSVIFYHYLSVIICIISFLYVLYKCSRYFRNITIKKIGFSKTSIEVENKNSKSILNHHLDEIIYYFEVTKYNIVIIEDLDRFEQAEIFTKLREINLLLNNTKKIMFCFTKNWINAPHFL